MRLGKISEVQTSKDRSFTFTRSGLFFINQTALRVSRNRTYQQNYFTSFNQVKREKRTGDKLASSLANETIVFSVQSIFVI